MYCTTYGGFITEAYGALGKVAWDFTNKIAKRERVGGDPNRYNPWSRPEWKRHFILTIGFSIQRGNTVMFVLRRMVTHPHANISPTNPVPTASYTLHKKSSSLPPNFSRCISRCLYAWAA